MPGVDDADLYFQYTRSEGWSLEEGIVKTGSFSIDQGVGVRAVSGEKTAFAYSDDICAGRAASMPRTAVRAIAAAGPEPAGQGRHAQGRQVGARAVRRARPDRHARQHAPRWRCSSSVERLRHAPRTRACVQVMAGLAGEYEVVLVARADGTLAADVRPLVRVVGDRDRRAGRPARESARRAAAAASDFGYFDDALLHELRRRGGACRR